MIGGFSGGVTVGVFVDIGLVKFLKVGYGEIRLLYRICGFFVWGYFVYVVYLRFCLIVFIFVVGLGIYFDFIAFFRRISGGFFFIVYIIGRVFKLFVLCFLVVCFIRGYFSRDYFWLYKGFVIVRGIRLL